MIVHAAESLYWFNTTEPPYLIKGASDIARVTSHNSREDAVLYGKEDKSLIDVETTGERCCHLSCEHH